MIDEHTIKWLKAEEEALNRKMQAVRRARIMALRDRHRQRMRYGWSELRRSLEAIGKVGGYSVWAISESITGFKGMVHLWLSV
jgi:hypothetical protein